MGAYEAYFFPMFIFAFIESRYISKEYKSFWRGKLKGIELGLALIPVFYYTINGIFGKTPDFVNIAIFFATTAIVYLAETRLLERNSINCKSPVLALVILWLIALAFAVLTFAPPHIPLFEDPVTKTYGYIINKP